MQRRLILMRHAKSSWDSGADSDHDRPLAKRGKRDAARVAAELERLGWLPEITYTSPAQRARQTWKRMAKALGDEATAISVLPVDDFYMGDLDAIHGAAARWPPEIGTVLVLGHNPGWEEALHVLAGGDEALTTGNAALLVGGGATWVDALEANWRLTALLRPRELGDD
ncbi:MAG: phosphohistidine phosphatase [Deltaproteobacteria bacterium HGW-Deltaproteobacteria-14]|jgi:phosphohistidine phosphatase|nr:MAG: phosphohistidine phosphatase [Deltaproteobacteria bacterium HGW-Deltaproteobacteria-14]